MVLLQRMLSEKGKTLILLENYKFRQYRRLKSTEEMCWVCTNKNCTAKVYTIGPDDIFSRQTGNHQHQHDNEQVLNRQKINNAVKKRANEEHYNERPRKMIRREVAADPNVLNTFTDSDMTRIGKNLNRARLQCYPKLPKSREEVHEYLSSISVETARHEDFLMFNDVQVGVIFSCKSNLEFLCAAEIVMVDGTFEFCAKFFLQMFTILAYINGRYIPLVFSLLHDKKETSYSLVFSAVKSKCQQLGCVFSPTKVVSDFERAIHGAVSTEFPLTTLVGCRFHLGQSWWRKIQNLGLTREYKDKNSPIGKWLHHMFGLTFLPADHVGDVFVQLLENQPVHPQVTLFADYIVENYIDDSAPFPTTLWAALDASVWRTNNGIEAFHSKFAKDSRSPHPNFHEFLEVIKGFQTETYAKINAVQTSAPKCSTNRYNSAFLENKIIQYVHKEIDAVTFVKCMSYKYSNY